MLSDIDLSFGNDVPPRTKQLLLGDETMVPYTSEYRGQDDVSTATCPSGRLLKHVVLHIQDHVHITADVTPFQNLLQFSPMTRLPPEIIAYIFELSLVGESIPVPVPVPGQGPFRLTQVCKLWRAVAKSDPHLWTSIHIHFPRACQGHEQDVPIVKSVLDLHLKRSGALPVSLTFTDHRFYHPAAEELVALLVDRLRTHSGRWKRISLHLSCGYFPSLFTFTPCNLSALEHLHISGDVLGQRRVATLHLNLESAKNLKSFAYSGPGHAVYDKIDLPWERLAEVSFGFGPQYEMSSTLSRHLGRLAQCRNITTCSLGIDRPFWSDLHDDETITLPCLQTLRVRQLSLRSHARSVLDPLVLPQLQTLEIDGVFLVGRDSWCQPWHDHNFSNLLARSGCALRRLSIQDVDFPNDELARCLELSDTLTSLRFIPYPRSQNIADVIRALNVSHPEVGSQYRISAGTRVQVRAQRGERDEQKHVTDGPLVPRLREITLASSIMEDLSLMMDMCRSRGGARACPFEVSALQRVEAVFVNMPDVIANFPDRLARVTSLQREMARWVSEIKNKNRNGNENENAGSEGGLEASVIVKSP